MFVKRQKKLHLPSAQFHLEDPCCRLLRTEYNCLHDPHLQAYYNRKDTLQSLKSKGFITSSGKVVCSLKEFNESRQYLTTLKLEAEKIRRQEEEKLQQELAELRNLTQD
ncbi:fibrous sheath-interacting protein 2 [Mergus octosetaceus]